MIRAIAKATLLWGFGNLPGGHALYRSLTRRAMGTQATHIDKLARVWPGYVRIWYEAAGLELQGKTVWIHDGGWTVLPFLMLEMLTGRGGIVTNEDGQMLDRYTRHALEMALRLEFGSHGLVRELLDENITSATKVIDRTGGAYFEKVDPSRLPMKDASVDLVHSGGVLEHYPVDKLDAVIAEMHRILSGGGIASHVFDHRDHLYHADKRYPFLNHLRLGDKVYRLLFGHRLIFHNRLLPGEVVERFSRHGFEPILVRRLSLPSGSYFVDEMPADAHVGLDRSKLAARFADATDLDLRTAAAHYLFRKR